MIIVTLFGFIIIIRISELHYIFVYVCYNNCINYILVNIIIIAKVNYSVSYYDNRIIIIILMLSMIVIIIFKL